MAQEQYDVTPKMRELFNKKQEQRNAAKAFWRKQLYNPYEQSRPFDPVLMRYTGMSAYSALYYKENFRQKFRFMLYLSPFFIFGYLLIADKRKREELWQSGKISYEARADKLLY